MGKRLVNAETVHMEYWAGMCPVCRLYVPVEFVGRNADEAQRKSYRALRHTFGAGNAPPPEEMQAERFSLVVIATR